MIHLRFEGRSYDLNERNLSLGNMASDKQIIESLARFLEIDVDKFRHYLVDRRPSGAVIVRPEAVYG